MLSIFMETRHKGVKAKIDMSRNLVEPKNKNNNNKYN